MCFLVIWFCNINNKCITIIYLVEHFICPIFERLSKKESSSVNCILWVSFCTQTVKGKFKQTERKCSIVRYITSKPNSYIHSGQIIAIIGDKSALVSSIKLFILYCNKMHCVAAYNFFYVYNTAISWNKQYMGRSSKSIPVNGKWISRIKSSLRI